MCGPKMIQREIKHVSVTKVSYLLNSQHFHITKCIFLPKSSQRPGRTSRSCQSFSFLPPRYFYILIKSLVPAYVSRKSQGFPEEEREIILAPQLFSVICTLFAQAHFLQNFLGGVRINKTEQKPKTSVVKDFKRTKGRQKLTVSTRPGNSLTVSETVNKSVVSLLVLS